MEPAVALLDTPKRAALQSEAARLRTVLKDFERAFAADHDGHKPGKEDIKADAAIAAQYREYNRVRDVLAGKLHLESLHQPQSPSRRRRSGRSERTVSLTPQKSGQATRRESRLHPSDIDPYDAPTSISPQPTLVTAIGPTPQRDGRVLGIFDLLFTSTSEVDTQDTPSANRKRKIDSLYMESPEKVSARHAPVAETPNQRHQKRSGEILDSQSAGTPPSGGATGRRKYSRTPTSEGKKFMLSQFFATPSATRYASIMEQDEPGSTGKTALQDRTPLRTRILGLSPREKMDHRNDPDATPAYLKRSFSFKERLLSASGVASDPDRLGRCRGYATSPIGSRIGPLARQSSQFVSMPLSQRIADQQDLKDQPYDDDLDALREIESNEVNVHVGNGQGIDMVQKRDEDENSIYPRTWKKKGQKRTTRRAMIRPAQVKVKEAPTFVAADEDEDEQNGPSGGKDGKATRVETQSVGPRDHSTAYYSGSEDELHVAEGDMTKPKRRRAEAVFEDEADDHESEGGMRKSKGPRRTKSKADGVLGRPIKDQKAHKSGCQRSKEKDPPVRTINPNAYAHMNFRSLKIKNKNSKAKGAGRGRFGRRR